MIEHEGYAIDQLETFQMKVVRKIPAVAIKVLFVVMCVQYIEKMWAN